MKLASAIGSIYLGIYMILPACLCQLLAVFGISLHESSPVEGPCAFSGPAVSIACHCDDHNAKSAEPELSRVETPVYPGAPATSAHEAEAGSWLKAAKHRLNARGPPGAHARDYHRTFSGVFLI